MLNSNPSYFEQLIYRDFAQERTTPTQSPRLEFVFLEMSGLLKCFSSRAGLALALYKQHSNDLKTQKGSKHSRQAFDITTRSGGSRISDKWRTPGGRLSLWNEQLFHNFMFAARSTSSHCNCITLNLAKRFSRKRRQHPFFFCFRIRSFAAPSIYTCFVFWRAFLRSWRRFSEPETVQSKWKKRMELLWTRNDSIGTGRRRRLQLIKHPRFGGKSLDCVTRLTSSERSSWQNFPL